MKRRQLYLAKDNKERCFREVTQHGNSPHRKMQRQRILFSIFFLTFFNITFYLLPCLLYSSQQQNLLFQHPLQHLVSAPFTCSVILHKSLAEHDITTANAAVEFSRVWKKHNTFWIVRNLLLWMLKLWTPSMSSTQNQGSFPSPLRFL